MNRTMLDLYQTGVIVSPKKFLGDPATMYEKAFKNYKKCKGFSKMYSRLHSEIWYPKTDSEKERKSRYYSLMKKWRDRATVFELVLEGRYNE